MHDFFSPHSNVSMFPDLSRYFGEYNAIMTHSNYVQNCCNKADKMSLLMSRTSYPWRWCCWESPHPWKIGWIPAVGAAGGCDRASSRTALMPGSWLLTQSSSPSPQQHASDSTSCDYRGSGTWGGKRERIPLGKPACGGRGGGGRGIWKHKSAR